MSIPPLPDELARFTSTEGEHRALKMFVLEYGQACREAALEEALKERDALKADAERYRWMTTQIVSGDLDVLEKALGKLDPEAESVTQEQFDGVIDVALRAVL